MVYEIAGYRWKKPEDQEEERLVRRSLNTVNLCIDVCGAECQSGRLYHLYAGEPVVFQTLFQALNRMDELYDELRFPQASTVLRSFRKDRREAMEQREWETDCQRKGVDEMEKFEKVIEHRGERATFLIRVQYRQHSSWQGEVVWVDQQKREYFRSALELVRLMDSALNTEEEKDAE